jgi:hypothetical protein
MSADDVLQALLWRACVGWYVLCVGASMLMVRLIFSVATYPTVDRTEYAIFPENHLNSVAHCESYLLLQWYCALYLERC